MFFGSRMLVRVVLFSSFFLCISFRMLWLFFRVVLVICVEFLQLMYGFSVVIRLMLCLISLWQCLMLVVMLVMQCLWSMFMVCCSRWIELKILQVISGFIMFSCNWLFLVVRVRVRLLLIILKVIWLIVFGIIGLILFGMIELFGWCGGRLILLMLVCGLLESRCRLLQIFDSLIVVCLSMLENSMKVFMLEVVLIRLVVGFSGCLLMVVRCLMVSFWQLGLVLMLVLMVVLLRFILVSSFGVR